LKEKTDSKTRASLKLRRAHKFGMTNCIDSRWSLPRATTRGGNDKLDFKDSWGQFLQAIKPYNHSLAAILKSARVSSISEGNLVIEVDFDFHRKKIEDKKNLAAIEQAIENSFGRKMRVECRVAKAEIKEKSIKDMALEVFK